MPVEDTHRVETVGLDDRLGDRAAFVDILLQLRVTSSLGLDLIPAITHLDLWRVVKFGVRFHN